MDALIEPFRFEFFRNGFIVAALAGALCGLVGVYVVVRSMSYIGHGLSHAIFGGAAAAAVLSVNFFVGAGIWGVASALAIGQVSRRRIIGADAAIGIITTAGFALGIIMLGAFSTPRRNIDSLLFGSILGVEVSDILAIAIVAILVLIFIVTNYRHLLFTSFDPDVAVVSGVKTQLLDASLMAALAAVILVTMKVLGVTMIAAILVIPAATARLLTDRFFSVLLLSTALGTGSGIAGMYLSYHLNVSSGGSIVLAGTIVFLLAFSITRRAGKPGQRGELHTPASNKG